LASFISQGARIAQSVYWLDYCLDKRRILVRFLAEAGYLFSKRPDRLWGTPSVVFSVCRRFFSVGRGDKAALGRVDDRSPLSGAELQISVTTPSLPHAIVACSGANLFSLPIIYAEVTI
jgi:hypothetical protein